MIRETLAKIIDGVSLTTAESVAVMNEMMDGVATHAQVGAFLASLRMKGETEEEILGFVNVMRERSVKIRPQNKSCIDTCGTGGDASHSFNISTATAFVVAGSGLSVAKHGNRSATSKCGSADVLEALGCSINMPVDKVRESIDTIGFGFMFAPLFHQSMKNVATQRREIGIRTVFNILGPLTNPAGAPSQLIGSFSLSYAKKMAAVLASLGTERALVVHGRDGLDEITLSGVTDGFMVEAGTVTQMEIDPAAIGIGRASSDQIKGGDASTNAEIIRNVLSGVKGVHRDIVLINVAAALLVGKKVKTLQEGFRAASEAIDSGSAAKKLNDFREFSNDNT